MSTGNYKMISVTGRDAKDFLQGQLTQDIGRIDRDHALLAAWCNPKGRVITVLRVLKVEAGYGLVLPGSLAEAICQRLAIFRLRAKVDFAITGSDWIHRVFHSDDALAELGKLGLLPERQMNACRGAGGLTAVNIGVEESCVEVFGLKADFAKAGIDTNEHTDCGLLRGAKVRAGIAEILADTTEKYTPHMLNLDLLGAISFDKGCYTGQEVVARTQNLGRSKRRIMRYRADRELEVGDRLSDGDLDVGVVVNVDGLDLLAVTPVALHHSNLCKGAAALEPAKMPYATTDESVKHLGP